MFWKPRKENVSSGREHLTVSKVADLPREAPTGLGSWKSLVDPDKSTPYCGEDGWQVLEREQNGCLSGHVEN